VLTNSQGPALLAEASQYFGQIVRSIGATLNSLQNPSRFTPENDAPISLDVSLQHIVAEVCVEFCSTPQQKGLALGEPPRVFRRLCGLSQAAMA